MTKTTSGSLALLQGGEFRATVSKLATDATRADAEARRLNTELKNKKFALAVLVSLKKSWDVYDAGKYDVASWLLTEAGNECVAQELLPPNTPVFTDKVKWDNFLEELAKRRGGNRFSPWEGYPREAVSPNYPVIPLVETLHVACPTCNTSRPVIKTLLQTEDCPDGDTWESGRYVFCCEGLLPVAKLQYL